MIHLVLQAAPEQSDAVEFDFLPMPVEAGANDVLAPSVRVNFGLITTSGPCASSSSCKSTVKIRLLTLTCGAAKPMPGAWYIVSNISSRSCARSGGPR
jgi:hypothetical protein